MNAKEFSCGLSEICSNFQKDKQPEEVRREFVFRYYDMNGEGSFEMLECFAHLKSYRISATRYLEREVASFCDVFGIEAQRLKAPLNSEQLVKLAEQFDGSLKEFTEEVSAQQHDTTVKTRDCGALTMRDRLRTHRYSTCSRIMH